MFPKRLAAVLLLAACLIAANAAPMPATTEVVQSHPEAVVRANVGDTINKEIKKVSKNFKLSKTAIIAIAVGSAAVVLLLLCCIICCCCGCCFK